MVCIVSKLFWIFIKKIIFTRTLSESSNSTMKNLESLAAKSV